VGWQLWRWCAALEPAAVEARQLTLEAVGEPSLHARAGGGGIGAARLRRRRGVEVTEVRRSKLEIEKNFRSGRSHIVHPI
jgi:hypothetical protein